MPINRKALQHVPPSSVRDSWFFITLCCEQRGLNQLCRPRTASSLLEAAVFYHHHRRWSLHLFLLMPDHAHLIAGFPSEENMSDVIRDWKRFTARRDGIGWQRNYFDHRVRPDEGLHLKSAYIRQNPVRAGLIEKAEDWSYFIDHNPLEGR